jgi:phosphatidate phosphatase APP1
MAYFSPRVVNVRRRDTVVLYRGFGARDSVFVLGRALENRPIAPADAAHSRWQNLLAMLRRANANPLPHAIARVTIGSATHDFTADDEGFIAGWMPAANPRRLDDEWIEVDAELVVPSSGGSILGRGSALCPVAAPEYLVISDIDDTVLQSRVTNFLRAAQTLAFGNARTRLPFPGVAAFYQALRRGASGSGRNALFYVSSSPWNLYDVITQFLELQGIPEGPVLLRDLDINLGVLSSRRHHDHKGDHIRRVLNTYPESPAILIGDSGQQDPEIYHDIVHEFTGRIRAVYIRNVTMSPTRSAAIEALAREVLAAGSSLVLADDTLAAARHAAEHGFISADALPSVGEEKKADEGITSEKAKAPGVRSAEDQPTPTVVVEDRR